MYRAQRAHSDPGPRRKHTVYTGVARQFLGSDLRSEGPRQPLGQRRSIAANTERWEDIKVNESTASGKSTCAHTAHS